MKKFITLLLAAVMLMTVALPLSSCSPAARLNRMDEPDRAVKLFEMSNQKADTASSFTMEQTMTMKMDIAGTTYDQKGVAKLTAIDSKDSFIYLEESEVSITSGGTFTMIYEDSGYADGYMFVRYKENADELKLKSPITKDEYFAFREEMADDSTIDVEVENGLASVMTCVQNEDKTWKATYEGFSEEGMKPFMEMLDGIEYTVTADHPIVDVRLTWETNEELYPTKTSIEFIFEKNPKADSKVPTLSIVSVYQGWNNTVLSQPYDINDFTEVEGLALPAGANAVHKATNGAGYAILVNGKGGYGGDIVMAVGIDNDGKIIETKVISHQETSGLGSKVAEADFRKQFPGMDSSLSGFSAIGGVTVSSNAFKNGLTAAFAAFELAK